MTEADRLLRRADWQWLLPEHRVERVLCMEDGELAASARLLVGDDAFDLDRRGTRGSAPPSGLYDLVLSERTDAHALTRSRLALRPGGVLYAEPRARTARQRAVLRARLATAGFASVQFIAPWPSLAAPLAWLPLGSGWRTGATAGARYLLLRHPLPARHPLRRLWLAGRRRTALARLAAGWARQVTVVARAADPADGVMEDPPAPWWTGIVARDQPTPEWLVLTPGSGVGSRVVGLLLPRGARQPTSVVKLGRTPDARARMARNADVLDRLRDAGVTTDGRVPASRGRLVNADGQVIATAESALHGRWLDTTLDERTVVRTANAITEWLLALAVATRGPERADTWRRAYRPVFDDFVSASGDALDRAVRDDVGALLASVPPMPTVLTHRDFRPWNVYVTPAEQLAVFDWDGADVTGVPLLDLFHGHMSLGFALDRALATERFAESLHRREAGQLGAAWRAGIARHALVLGLSDHAVRTVRAFAWMDRAKEEAHAARAAGRVLTRADGRRGYLGLWEATARAALR